MNKDKIINHTLKHWNKVYIRNAALNCSFLRERAFGIEQLPKLTLYNALITGSGPSLDLLIIEKEYLKTIKNIKIFSSLSHAHFLIKNEIIPDYIIATDASPELKTFITPEIKNIPLITHPAISPKVVENWEGPIYIFMMEEKNNSVINKVIPTMYSEMFSHSKFKKYSFSPIYPVSLMNTGCVSNSSVQIASYLGVNKIFLAGVDYSFAEDIGRYDNRKIQTDEKIIRVNNNGVFTTSLMQFYADCFHAMLCINPELKLYSLSPWSLCDIPRLSYDELEKTSNEEEYEYKKEQIKAGMKQLLENRGVFNK